MPIKDVKVTIDGNTYTLTDNGDGTYSKTLTAPNKSSYQRTGHYYPVTIVATNMAGTSTTVNSSHETLGEFCRLVVKEVTAPTITIKKPTADQYFATATPEMEFELWDEAYGSRVAISTLKITVDGTTYTNTSNGVTVEQITKNVSSGGTSTTRYGYSVKLIPSTALVDGNHTVNLTVEDNDGNKATSNTIKFTTDTVAPTLTISNPSTSGTYTANSTLVVTGKATDSTSGKPTVKIKVNNASDQTVSVSSDGSFTQSVTLANGTNTIVITATDKVGKVTTITRTIILDTSSPVVASIEITPNPVEVGGSYTVKVTVS